MPLPPKACTTDGCRNLQPCRLHKKSWKGGAEYTSDERRRMRSVRELARRQGDHCWKCSKVDHHGEVDHRKNKAEGGSGDLKNLWYLCKQCHMKKTMQERLRGVLRSRGRRR